MSYHVNEIFYSLQGEGGRSGEASVFVRFAHCNLTCRADGPEGFDCDTNFSGGNRMSSDEIMAACEHLAGRGWIVFTGGEPMLQVDRGLIETMQEAGFKIAVETNGTRPMEACWFDWTCVSPKTAEHTMRVAGEVDELKYVMNSRMALPEPTLKARLHWLSPAFDPEGFVISDALGHCIELCKANPMWRVSMQQHKAWRVR